MQMRVVKQAVVIKSPRYGPASKNDGNPRAISRRKETPNCRPAREKLHINGSVQFQTPDLATAEIPVRAISAILPKDMVIYISLRMTPMASRMNRFIVENDEVNVLFAHH